MIEQEELTSIIKGAAVAWCNRYPLHPSHYPVEERTPMWSSIRGDAPQVHLYLDHISCDLVREVQARIAHVYEARELKARRGSR